MFVDPHTHLFISNYSTLEIIKRENYQEVYVLAYIPFKPQYHTTLVELFRWLIEVEPSRFKEVGINLRVGLGIHPRNIPSSGLTSLLNSSEEFLIKADLIGEVGLELGTEEEVMVLSEMLRLADILDKPVIIHTPRRGKDLILKKLLNVLSLSRVQPNRVVVDHASYELIEEFLSFGTLVGLTVQPGKLNVSQLVELVKSYPELIEVGMVNSDCGRDPSEPLAVKLAYEGLISAGISGLDALKLVRNNALKLISKS